MIKKIYYMVLTFTLLFVFNMDITNAEETDENGNIVCKYRYDADRNVEISYNDTAYSVRLTDQYGNELTKEDFFGASPTGTYFNIDLLYDFEYNDWISYVNNSESSTGCPYSIVVSKMSVGASDYQSGSIRIQLKKYNFWNWNSWGWYQSTSPCLNCSDVDFDFTYNSTEFECSSLLGERTICIINEIMGYIRILVPVGLIFDFTRAMFASSEEDMKKIQKMFIRRIIVAVLIFLSPVIVNIAISITNDISGFVRTDTCGIL